MKEKYIHFGLLALGALIVLWFLFRNKNSGVASATAAPAVPTSVTPAAVPATKLGDVNISYNEPSFDGYGPQVSAEVGDGPNSACDCGQAGQVTNYPTVSADVFQAAVSNFQSFLSKGAAPAAAPSTAQTVTAKPAPAPRPVKQPVRPPHVEAA